MSPTPLHFFSSEKILMLIHMLTKKKNTNERKTETNWNLRGKNSREKKSISFLL